MAWRLAYSLDELRREVNARWPNRSTVSDGTIGNPAHQAEASDHNPNAAGVVCAFDITNDPANGPDIGALADELLANIHPDAKYLIWRSTIASARYGWVRRPYAGDPHTSHLHVSVGVGPDGQSVQPYDDRTPPWLQSQPQPPEDDAVKWSYAQVQGDGRVFLVNTACAPRHVTDFAAAEFHLAREGHTLVPPPVGATVSIEDGAHQVRPVMVLDDAVQASNLFGIV